MNRFLLLATLTAALGLTASGCHNPTQSQTNTPPPMPQTAPSLGYPAAPTAKVVVYVLNPNATGDQDLLVPHAVALRHPEAPAQDALTDLLQSAHSPIAPGTALRGLSIANGLATVDFSQSPVNETGGESAQSAALNALALTLGQFPEITQYQIQAKGRLVKAFGEFTTDGPMDVIRPGEKPNSEGSPQ